MEYVSVYIKGAGWVKMPVGAAIALVIIFSFLLFFLLLSETKQKESNIKIADSASVQQEEWVIYELPKEGMEIPYRKHSTGMSAEAFIIPPESKAKEKDGILVVILPAGVELVDELEYLYGAGSKDGQVRMVIRLDDENHKAN